MFMETKTTFDFNDVIRHMSWTSWTSLALALFAMLSSLPFFGVFSHLSRIFVQFPILFLLLICSIMAFAGLSKDGNPEKTTWMWLMLASIFVLIGDTLFVIGNQSNSIVAVTFSSVLMFCSYAGFIIGLLAIGLRIRASRNKTLFWIPSVIALIVFVMAGVMMYRSFLTSTLDDTLKITFTVYLLADFVLIISNMLVVARTSGGKLSLPYLVIGIGCCFLVAYQVASLFMISTGANIYTSTIQLVFVLALAILVAGVDIRHGIQKQLPGQAKSSQ